MNYITTYPYKAFICLAYSVFPAETLGLPCHFVTQWKIAGAKWVWTKQCHITFIYRAVCSPSCNRGIVTKREKYEGSASISFNSHMNAFSPHHFHWKQVEKGSLHSQYEEAMKRSLVTHKCLCSIVVREAWKIVNLSLNITLREMKSGVIVRTGSDTEQVPNLWV